MEMMEIISNIDYLFSVLVPGVVFLYVYDVLAIKKYSLQFYIIAGCVAGTIIKTVTDSANSICVKFWCLPISLLFVYIVLAIVSAVLFYFGKNSLPVRKFFKNTFHIETSDNFWTRYWDMAGDTVVYAYTTDGNVSFGTLQSADDNDILLIQHRTAFGQKRNDIDSAFDEPARRTILRIPMKNVSRIELRNMDKNSEIEKFVFGDN